MKNPRYKQVQIDPKTHDLLVELAALTHRTQKGVIDWLVKQQLAEMRGVVELEGRAA
jgi:hypothetical protein